jgi:hypothetical protein
MVLKKLEIENDDWSQFFNTLLRERAGARHK